MPSASLPVALQMATTVSVPGSLRRNWKGAFEPGNCASFPAGRKLSCWNLLGKITVPSPFASTLISVRWQSSLDLMEKHRKVVHLVVRLVRGKSEIEVVSLLLGLAPKLCHGGSGSDVDRLVVGHLDDQILELGLENLARQH